MICSGIKLFEALKKTVLDSGVLDENGNETENGPHTLEIALTNLVAAIFSSTDSSKAERIKLLHTFCDNVQDFMDNNDRMRNEIIGRH